MSGAFTPLLPWGQALSDCNYPKRILIAGVKSPYIEYACISLLACGGQTLKGFLRALGTDPRKREEDVTRAGHWRHILVAGVKSPCESLTDLQIDKKK